MPVILSSPSLIKVWADSDVCLKRLANVWALHLEKSLDPRPAHISNLFGSPCLFLRAQCYFLRPDFTATDHQLSTTSVGLASSTTTEKTKKTEN